MKKIIATDKGPAAIGPYSQAVDCGHFLVTSRQVPFDPATGELSPGGFAEETLQGLPNFFEGLSSPGS
jgi:Putative translation initiation inhibitor, yjgF family